MRLCVPEHFVTVATIQGSKMYARYHYVYYIAYTVTQNFYFE